VSWSRRTRRVLVAATGMLVLAVPAVSAATASAGATAAGAAAGTAATSPDSPVDLATPVNFAAAVATKGAIVSVGDARFEVLGDGLIRLEYSPSGNFEDLPTVNVLNRRFPVPPYRATTGNG